MKLAVTGSRSFNDHAWLERCLLRSFRVGEIEAVITGGARGADALAARFARSHGIPLIVLEADWERWGRKAGPIRNTSIVFEADALAAFWDGVSPGTRDTIAKARRAGLRVEVYPCAPDEEPSPSSMFGPSVTLSIPRASSILPRRAPAFSRGESVSSLLFPELEDWSVSHGTTGSSSASRSKKG